MLEHPLARYYDETVEELKRAFTAEELAMILDAMNGTLLTAGIMGQQVVANVEDAFRLYPGVYEEKWKVDRAALLEKLARCNAWQLGVLEIWAERFWQRVGRRPPEDSDPREYIARGKSTVVRALDLVAQELDNAVCLLEKTKGAFKSKLVGDAREGVARARGLLREI